MDESYEYGMLEFGKQGRKNPRYKNHYDGQHVILIRPEMCSKLEFYHATLHISLGVAKIVVCAPDILSQPILSDFWY